MATPKCKAFIIIDDTTGSAITRTTVYLPVYSEGDECAQCLFLSSLSLDLQRIFKKAGNNFYILWEMLSDLAHGQCQTINRYENLNLMCLMKDITSKAWKK